MTIFKNNNSNEKAPTWNFKTMLIHTPFLFLVTVLLLLPLPCSASFFRTKKTKDSSFSGSSSSSSSNHNNNSNNSNNIQTRIVGGSPVSFGFGSNTYQYNWFAYLENGCGGSLVYDDMVLTAAHCSVAVGDRVFMGHPDYTQANFVTTVKWVRNHDQYSDERGKWYDFKMVQLTDPAPYNEGYVPILMNSDNAFPPDATTLTALGHGWRDEQGTTGTSTILNQVDVPYIEHCDGPGTLYAMGGFNYNRTVHVCAGETGKDSCKGDSGT